MIDEPKWDQPSWAAIEALFHKAVEVEPPQREAFLRESCSDKPEMLAKVRELLRASDQSADFMEPPNEVLTSKCGDEPYEVVQRRRIGAFQTVRVIASGGMGTVYEAVQDEPRRTVALKLLRRGASTSASRRFRQEVELLAHLRHPGIAQIYEAGTFDDDAGPTPYFAMEYLPEGKNIVDFANDAELSIRERLALFIEVCDAVHHGHQRGVIHRDLKPANILVDASGCPKVIDFGVARATDSDLAVATGHTAFGQLIGTPAYMSPDQCAGDAREIDIRSDVYSLGVVAFELLCGALPYDLADKPVPEVLRIIQHEPPRKPSGIRPVLRGDLETILLKALAKEPEHRYASVADLAGDIRRYLRHEPIEARPPSTTYQLRLFARRHRAFVAAAASIAVVLLAAATVSVSFAVRASQAAARETQARVQADRMNQFLKRTLTSLDARRRDRPVITVRQMLDEAAERVDGELASFPEIEADVRTQLGLAYQTLGLHDDAFRHLQRALELRERWLGNEHPDTALSRSNLGVLATETGDCSRAYELLDAYVGTLEKRGATDSGEYVRALDNLAVALFMLGRYDEARPVCSRALELAHRLYGEEHRDIADCLDTRGLVYFGMGDYDEAEKALRASLDMSRQLLGDEHLLVATTINNLGNLLRSTGDFATAEELFLESLAIKRKLLSDTHPDVAVVLANLAHVLHERGDHAGAAERIKEALEIQKRTFGQNHPNVAYSLAGLGIVLQQQGDYEGAEAALRESLAVRVKLFGEDDPITAHGMSNLSVLLQIIGKYEEAETLLTEAIPILRDGLGVEHPNTNAAMEHLATIKLRTRDLEGAEELLLEVLGTERRLFDGSHPRVLRALGNLASVYYAKGELEKAEKYFRDLLERPGEAFSDRHSDVLRRRSDLAKVIRDQERIDEALAIYREVAATQREVLPADHPDLARTLLGMAVALTDRGEYEKAEAHAQEGFDIRRRALPAEHVDAAEAATVLARSQRKQNKLAESEALLLAAYPILRDKLGREAEKTQSALLELVELYEALGRQREADEYRLLLIESPTSRITPGQLSAQK